MGGGGGRITQTKCDEFIGVDEGGKDNSDKIRRIGRSWGEGVAVVEG